MKIQILKWLTGIAILILMVSCEKDIEFSGELTEPMLVVNCLAAPDSVLSVKVTESRFFLSNEDNYDIVDDATVKIYLNGNYVDDLKYSTDGLYTSDFIPESGDELKISVTAPGYDPVESEVIIPEKVSITSIDTTSIVADPYPLTTYGYYDSNGNGIDTIGFLYTTYFNFTVNFKDPSEETNYYRLVVFSKMLHDDGSISQIYNSIDFTDIVSGNTANNGNDLIEIQYASNDYNVFSDELFNGNTYPLKFKVRTDSLIYRPDINDGIDNGKILELNVDIQTISKSYYLYLKTFSSYTGEIFGSFFSEPIQIHSNIKGGIGIFGGYTRNITSFDLTP